MGSVRLAAKEDTQNKSFNRKRSDSLPRRVFAVCVAVATAFALCVPCPVVAYADTPSTVQTVNPDNTVVNVFDYWVSTQDDYAQINANNSTYNDSAINEGHTLKFNSGSGSGINKWTGSKQGPLAFVQKKLDEGGYPAIQAGTYQYETISEDEAQSLSYLFDNSDVEGKQRISGVTGLFQLDSGYYYYDCSQNYAALSGNAFNVYSGHAPSNKGQFFPFNSWETASSAGSASSTSLNHHFGLSMETKFVQPSGGVTPNGDDMTYSFSGDDDVWVYIDGLLVGDLGGIHDAVGLDINFKTGEVVITRDLSNASGPVKYSTSTIKELMQAADSNLSDDEFSGDTLKDNTRHTLQFFYLERGANESNMKLKFNLQSQPISEIEKTDENGAALEGAEFELYSADEKYDYTVDDRIASGTTDEDGKLVLTDANNSPISFDTEAAEGKTRFVLKETKRPAGYRTSLDAAHGITSGELQFEYVSSPETSTTAGGVLVARTQTIGSDAGDASWSWTGSQQWLNGGYVADAETMVAPLEVTDSNGNVVDQSSGTLFAVVLKHTGSGNDEDSWTPVSGNASEGYALCGVGVAGAIAAAKTQNTVFKPNSSQQLVTTVENLPGDITTYKFMQQPSEQASAQYSVAVYYTAGSLDAATAENTVQVDSSQFTRLFSSRLHLTNIKNRLFVQKTDESGTPLSGASFELYKASQVDATSSSTGGVASVSVHEGESAFDAATTGSITYPYELEGGGVFPSSDKALDKGIYYLRESAAPSGYTINDTWTKVIVDDSGVYVDAGSADDGVDSMSGPGALVNSLAQFGSNKEGDVDNTLTHVKGYLQSASLGSDGSLSWQFGESSSEGITPSGVSASTPMLMKWGKKEGDSVLQYDQENSTDPAIIYAKTGINRMALFQNKQTSEGEAFNGTDLGSLQLNTLFTTASGVRYTDKEETPVSPDNPDVPDTPDEPDNPDQPDTPDNPDNPDQPDTPDTPDRPDNSGNSDQPNNSNNSDASDQPDASDQSDISDNPDNPNDSGTKNHTQAAQTSDAVMEYTAPLMLIALFSALVIRVSCARCRRAARTGISKQEWR